MTRLLGASLAAAVAVAPGLSACDAGGPAVASAPIDIGPPRYHVEITNDGRAIVLRRSAEALLVLGADAFQAGVVEALDDSASYDPYAFEGREDEAGIAFRVPVHIHAEALLSAGASVILDYGDGLGARVDIHDEGDAGFTFTMTPSTSAAGAPAIAVMRVRAGTSGDATSICPRVRGRRIRPHHAAGPRPGGAKA